MKIKELKELPNLKTESEYIGALQNLETKRSQWVVINQFVCLSFHLTLKKSYRGSCSFALPIQHLSVLSIQTRNIWLCRFWYKIGLSYPVKLNSGRTKKIEQYITIITMTDVNLEKTLLIKDPSKLEKLNSFTKNFLIRWETNSSSCIHTLAFCKNVTNR